MGIKVEHRISGDVLGDASYASGQAQGMERRREQDRNYQLQQEINAIREKARQDANARFFAQLQAQTQARNEQMDFSERQYEEFPERQQQLGQIENDLKKDFTDFQYSRSQQQQLDKLAQARDYVRRNPDGRYTPEEQQQLLQQIDEAEYGIQPIQRKENTPWPKEQDLGQVWTDENTGATFTRDDKGNVKVLVKPENQGLTFNDQLKLKKEIASYAENIIRTSQGTENEIDRTNAMKMAEQFFGNLPGTQNRETNPPADSSEYGDEESMADSILRQVMSPQTYEAAKATGLPAKDIYYMTQQLMNQTKAPAPAESNSSGNIGKDQWMSNNDNFNQYRKRFASGIPQGQIEQAYKNDPYIDSNHSVLADPNHKVTTPYATWEELTDSQRDKAYEKYTDENKLPLGDRFGMAVSRVISQADYKNYKQKEQEHKAKLLTQEQFAQKCEDDPEFLWKFIKASNSPQPVNIDSTQVDMHRAIDAYSKPVFGGLR